MSCAAIKGIDSNASADDDGLSACPIDLTILVVCLSGENNCRLRANSR